VRDSWSFRRIRKREAFALYVTGAVHQVLDETKVMPHGTAPMNRGLAVGQIAGGIFAMVGGATGEVLGGAASVTGIGAAIGVPAMVVSSP
jgi:hypothetical protein